MSTIAKHEDSLELRGFSSRWSMTLPLWQSTWEASMLWLPAPWSDTPSSTKSVWSVATLGFSLVLAFNRWLRWLTGSQGQPLTSGSNPEYRRRSEQLILIIRCKHKALLTVPFQSLFNRKVQRRALAITFYVSGAFLLTLLFTLIVVSLLHSDFEKGTAERIRL